MTRVDKTRTTPRPEPSGLPDAVSRARRIRIGRRTSVWLSMLPVLLLIALFTLYPFGFAAVTSLRQDIATRPGVNPFVGLRNYQQVAGDPMFGSSAVNTLLFTVVAVPLVVTVGLAVALLLNQRFPGVRLLRVLVILPWAIPLVSAGIMWQLLLHGNFGAFNGLLLQLGIIDSYQSWLTDPTTARIAVLVAHVWREFPLAVILFLAGLQAIPDQLHEAASLDGAGPWTRLRHIVLPLLRAPMLIVFVYQTIVALAVFDLIYVMTGGGPGSTTTLFSWFTYVSTFRFLNFGHGAALSFMIAITLLGFIVLYLRLFKPQESL